MANWWQRRAAPHVLRYAEGYLQRQFQSFRLAPGSLELLTSCATRPGPLLVALNHPSWWDPLAGLVLTRRCQGRQHRAPMDAEQLARFPFFSWLGMLPAHPGQPLSWLRPLGRELDDPRSNLMVWITPQGEFCDPRLPVRLQGGAAWLRDKHPHLRGLTLALEYPFWNQPRPEICARVAEWPAGQELTAAMESNSARLAELASLRDPALLPSLWPEPVARLHPVMDLVSWLRR